MEKWGLGEFPPLEKGGGGDFARLEGDGITTEKYAGVSASRGREGLNNPTGEWDGDSVIDDPDSGGRRRESSGEEGGAS